MSLILILLFKIHFCLPFEWGWCIIYLMTYILTFVRNPYYRQLLWPQLQQGHIYYMSYIGLRSYITVYYFFSPTLQVNGNHVMIPVIHKLVYMPLLIELTVMIGFSCKLFTIKLTLFYSLACYYAMLILLRIYMYTMPRCYLSSYCRLNVSG